MRIIQVKSLTLFLCLVPMVLAAQKQKPKETEIAGHTMYTLLKPGDIPAVFDPEFIPIDQADDVYYPDEPLIAVVDGDVAKGFSTWYLDHHEIVNDYINSKAITITW